MTRTTRRDFLWGAAGAGLLAGADWQKLAALAAQNPPDARVTPEIVRLNPEIEPLVERIETTPRDECPQMLLAELRRGTSYRDALAAIFLAGIRNVNPQPPGFKFHCVFAIHSANQLSQDAAAPERLLPLFWALDQFKSSQQEDVRLGDFRLPVVRGNLPSPESAWSEFHAAMEAWDEPRADRAITALYRTKGAHDVIDGLWRYGARDYRNIGHKAIFVANAWRTLQTIGWNHAEPVLRSLVLGLLDFKDRRVNDYARDDQLYVPNAHRAEKSIDSLPGTWTAAGSDPGVVTELYAALHEGRAECCELALKMLTDGRATSGAVWDAVHLASCDLMLRQPGIYGIHTVTSANALHHAFRVAQAPVTRLLLLLQGVGWMVQFHRFMTGRPEKLSETSIIDLAESTVGSPDEAAAEIVETVSADVPLAARKALALARRQPHQTSLARAARQMVFTKGADAHHYKYVAAIFEDCELVDPRWKPHLLAASVYYVPGAKAADSSLMQQVRRALAEV